MKVSISEEAFQQIDDIDGWWREHRLAAPHLFAQELEEALLRLEEVPSLGVTYDEGRAIRRLLLKRTSYHIYFTERPEEIMVVAVWSCRRGSGPPLP